MAQDYDTGGTFRPFWARTDMGTLFGQAIRLAASTVGLFTLGAYLARNMSGGWDVAFWIASFVCLVAMDLTVRQSEQPTVGVAVRLRLPAAARHRRNRQRTVAGGIDLPRHPQHPPVLPGSPVGGAIDGSDRATDAPILITGRNDR